METSLADIKKQYEKLKGILGDKDTLELSYEDDLRCQDALSLLKSRNYILDASTLYEKRYIKAAEWDGFGVVLYADCRDDHTADWAVDRRRDRKLSVLIWKSCRSSDRRWNRGRSCLSV